jgi:hypothetical protein
MVDDLFPPAQDAAGGEADEPDEAGDRRWNDPF